MMANTAGILLQNPILPMDLPDPDIIRVGDRYYMASASAHFTPGIPILKSRNLATWELAGYVYQRFCDDDAYNLSNGENVYGATACSICLRYHAGVYYVCVPCARTRRTYIYRSHNIESGRWSRSVLKDFYHDPTLFFDEGHCYLIYGQGTIFLLEVTTGATAVKEDCPRQVLVKTPRVNGVNCEGARLYKVADQYCLFLVQWPATGSNRKVQWCYRCPQLAGDYRGRVVLDSALGGWGGGVARGGVFCTEGGEWFALLSQDCGAVGHCPVLVPMEWQDGWPVLGHGGHVPERLPLPCWPSKLPLLVASDPFESDTNELHPVWQWNHNPDRQGWSLTERQGHLRLTNHTVVRDILSAPNVLTQKTVAPHCVLETHVDSTC
ncbi:MAG: family 43 glycosylhydrolase, partial [Oscillospiraceae bacterium]